MEAKFSLRHVRLNRGGYDSMGGYWGSGMRLYHCINDSGSIDTFFRAKNREKAKENVRKMCPNARFYN